jgi:hypothetical protein
MQDVNKMYISVWFDTIVSCLLIKCCKYFVFCWSTSAVFTAMLIMSSMIPLTILSLDIDETVRNFCIEFSVALSSTLIHVLAPFQRTTCSQIYFRFSSYLLRKPHLFVILNVIGWFIVNIQSDLFWHRCLERQAFGTPRIYMLSPSESIKGSNYGEFLKDKYVLLCTRLYKYTPNLESLLTQQYVCVMCTLWSDIIRAFLLVFIA